MSGLSFKFHNYRRCVTDFREKGLFAPHLWSPQTNASRLRLKHKIFILGEIVRVKCFLSVDKCIILPNISMRFRINWNSLFKNMPIGWSIQHLFFINFDSCFRINVGWLNSLLAQAVVVVSCTGDKCQYLT